MISEKLITLLTAFILNNTEFEERIISSRIYHTFKRENV